MPQLGTSPRSHVAWQQPLLVALLLAAWMQCGADGKLACEDSGYCSLGHVKPFFGDVHPSAGLQAALDARSYKKEVIIGVFLEQSVGQLLQWVWAIERLGIAHIMTLALEPKHCEMLLKLRPDMGCVYFSSPMSRHLRGIMLLWHWRYRLLARVVHKGYNAMSSDFDVMWFDDPYKYFKQPPFKDMQLMGQCENEWWDQCKNLNGGFIYAQNAQPYGPAVFVVGEVADRQLRWLDHDMEWIRAQQKISPGGDDLLCMHMDQAVLQEVVPSVMWGRPVFFVALYACQDRALVESKEFQAFIRNMEGEVMNKGFSLVRLEKHYRVDEGSDMAVRAGTAEILLPTYTMRVPNAHGEWPKEFGGRFLPPTRGEYSQAFLAELTADCPECPAWPNYEDVSEAAKANATREQFAFLPPWFFSPWGNRGRLGYWSTSPLQAVLGHVHFIPDIEGSVAKHLVQLHYGFYNWTLGNWLSNRVVGFRSYHSYLNTRLSDSDVPESRGGSGPEASPQDRARVPAAKLLTLSPDFPLKAIKSEAELRWLMVALLQLATLSHRTVVWPDVLCADAKWIYRKSDNGAESDNTNIQLPMPVRNHWYLPYGGDISKDPQSVHCAYLMLCHTGCFSGADGMMQVELEHWLDLRGMPRTPSPEQLLFPLGTAAAPAGSGARADRPQAGKRGQPVANGLLSMLLELDARDVKKALADRAEQPVLYLAHPVMLWYGSDPSEQEMRSTFSHRAQQCPATKMSDDGLKLTKMPLHSAAGFVDPLPQLRLGHITGSGHVVPTAV